MAGNELCKDCSNWENFKEKCFFYWEDKKECSQHKQHVLAEPKIKSIKQEFGDSVIEMLVRMK